MNRTIRNQGGVSLLEVLIAVVVFAIGLLAIAALQGQLVRTGADAKARSVGVNLAEQQMEQLRSFVLDTGASYGDITDRAEGDALVETVSGVEYRLWWEVDEYHFPPDSGNAVLGPAPSGNSDFKMIRLHADWTDESGEPQKVLIEDIIANAPPSDALLAVLGSPPPEHPIVRYRDILTAPEVIEVNLGDGTSRQSSRPRPEIRGEGPNVLTSFDAITFTNNLVEGFPVQLRREEFQTINCRCEQAGTGIGRTPAVWTGTQWVSGQNASKRIGAPLSGLDQPFLCDRCCRDHHDEDDGEKFDPFRPTGNDANGNPFYPFGVNSDHGHFIFDPDTGQLVPADADGAEYLEACTFTRIEGIFQVVPDFKLENLIVIPIEDLQASEGISQYQAFLEKFVEEYVSLIGVDYPIVTPNLDMNDPDNSASGELQAMWDAFSQTVAPPANGDPDGRRFLARGLYINFMNGDLLDRIAEAENALPFVPFQELNVTRLATWDDGASASIYVTKDALTSSNADTYDRGRAIHCASYTPTDGSGTVEPRCEETNATIIASIFTSNTGLLANANPTDTDDAVLRADSIMIDFELEPLPPPRTVKGDFSLHPSVQGVEMSNITVAASTGILCTRPEPTKYSCVFEEGVDTGTMTIGNYNSVDRTGDVNNHQVCPDGVVFDDGTTVVTNAGPTNDGLANETTAYDLVSMPNGEFILDIQIKSNNC